jgi:hypothetical protein
MSVILLNKGSYEKYSQNELISLRRVGNQLGLNELHQDEFDYHKSRVNYSYQNYLKVTYESWV